MSIGDGNDGQPAGVFAAVRPEGASLAVCRKAKVEQLGSCR
jgi:hypothetical protein